LRFTLLGHSEPIAKKGTMPHAEAKKTKLLMPGDDIVEIATYSAARPSGDDIVCLSKTALAITQKRYRFVSDIEPTRTSSILCAFFDGSEGPATSYDMQAAIDEVGVYIVVYALFVDLLGRLVGRRGVFHKIAGEKVSLIVPLSKAMPPYDKAIILSPLNAERTARRVAARLRCRAAVVAAGDDGTVTIVAATPGVDESSLAEVLSSNPAGQDKQTPIVVCTTA
jgi:hypothetical protein